MPLVIINMMNHPSCNFLSKNHPFYREFKPFFLDEINLDNLTRLLLQLFDTLTFFFFGPEMFFKQIKTPHKIFNLFCKKKKPIDGRSIKWSEEWT